MQRKIIFIIFSALAVLNIVFNIADVSGFEVAYEAVTAAAAVIATALALIKAARLKDRDALFTGALGLGILAVSEAYYLVHMFIGQEVDTSLNISDFSDGCSYLFFLAAILLLLLPPMKWEGVFRIGTGVVSVAVILPTTYSVMANNELLLNITAIATAFICLALSVYLFYQTGKIRQLKTARVFAGVMMFLGTLDIFVYLFSILDVASNWHNVLISLYSPLYMWICFGLLRLREFEERSV